MPFKSEQKNEALLSMGGQHIYYVLVDWRVNKKKKESGKSKPTNEMEGGLAGGRAARRQRKRSKPQTRQQQTNPRIDLFFRAADRRGSAHKPMRPMV